VSQALSPNTVKRLAFIRFLYSQGLEQAARPQPLAAAALLSFHDAVEMFLLLAAEHLSVNLDRNTTFDGYWTQIAAQASVQLPSRNAMRRMNNSRVNFKHHGSIPSATDLDQFRADVTTFFTDATQAVFAADFTNIDMTDLVTQQVALTRIRSAEAHASQGDYIEALTFLGEAFWDLVADYASRKRLGLGLSPYDFGPKPYSLGREALSQSEGGRICEAEEHLNSRINAIIETINPMRDAVLVLALGLDYRRYTRFSMLTPSVFRTDNGTEFVGQRPGLRLGDDEYQFCKLFVVETAVHLAELDFDLDLHSMAFEWLISLAQEQAAEPDAVDG
jgi:hypothetical protein